MFCERSDTRRPTSKVHIVRHAETGTNHDKEGEIILHGRVHSVYVPSGSMARDRSRVAGEGGGRGRIAPYRNCAHLLRTTCFDLVWDTFCSSTCKG